MAAEDDYACDTIRCSSSLARAPSWSSGVGSNSGRQIPSTSGCNLLYPNTYQPRSLYLEQFHDRLSSSLVESTNELRALNYSPHHSQMTIQIPTVYLTKKLDQDSKKSSSYHVYQITISTRSGETWSIYRRYSQFYSLHQELKSKDPLIGKKFRFPPKRRINSKSSTIVQERRKKLEEYIITLSHYLQAYPSDLLANLIDVNTQRQIGQQSTVSTFNNNDNTSDENTIFHIDDIDESDPINEDENNIKNELTTQNRSFSVSGSASSQDQNSSSISIGQSNSSNNNFEAGGSGIRDSPTISPNSSNQLPGNDSDTQADVRRLFLDFLSFNDKKDETLVFANLSGVQS